MGNCICLMPEVWFESSIEKQFYHRTLCQHSICRHHVSVHPSVTSQCSSETAKLKIMQTMPYDSSGTIVFWCQRSWRNSRQYQRHRVTFKVIPTASLSNVIFIWLCSSWQDFNWHITSCVRMKVAELHVCLLLEVVCVLDVYVWIMAEYLSTAKHAISI